MNFYRKLIDAGQNEIIELLQSEKDTRNIAREFEAKAQMLNLIYAFVRKEASLVAIAPLDLAIYNFQFSVDNFVDQFDVSSYDFVFVNTTKQIDLNSNCEGIIFSTVYSELDKLVYDVILEQVNKKRRSG